MTRKEKKVLTDGFHACQLIAETYDVKAEIMLKDALRMERRCRSSIYWAKGLICHAWILGYETDPRASEVYGLARGLQIACLVGADFRSRFKDLSARCPWIPGYITRIRAADIVRIEASRRRGKGV